MLVIPSGAQTPCIKKAARKGRFKEDQVDGRGTPTKLWAIGRLQLYRLRPTTLAPLFHLGRQRLHIVGRKLVGIGHAARAIETVDPVA